MTTKFLLSLLVLKHNKHSCYDRSITATVFQRTQPHFQVSGKHTHKHISMLFFPSALTNRRAKRPVKRIVFHSDSSGRGRGSATLMIQMNEKWRGERATNQGDGESVRNILLRCPPANSISFQKPEEGSGRGLGGRTASLLSVAIATLSLIFPSLDMFPYYFNTSTLSIQHLIKKISPSF